MENEQEKNEKIYSQKGLFPKIIKNNHNDTILETKRSKSLSQIDSKNLVNKSYIVNKYK